MNISHDFVLRFERVKEDFKTSMFKDLCRQVDAWFAPLLAELKASVVVDGCVSPGPQSLGDVDTSRDGASSHFSLSTSLLDHHQSTENGLIINNNDHLLVGSDPFWGTGGVVSDVVPSTIGRNPAEELSVGVDSIIASSTPVNIIESASSSLTAGGTVTNIKEELNSDHEETLDDHESGELFGEDEGSINCDCSDCRSEEEEEHEGAELFSLKKVKLERQLSDEIVFDGSPPPGTNFFEISSSSHHESAASPLSHSLVKTSLNKMHFCNNSTCHASFNKRCQLVVHQRSHWNTRFRCKWPNCKSDFASRSNIYRHLRSAHLPFEQQGQLDGEQDLKHLIEEITSFAKNSSTSSSGTATLEPQGSTSFASSGSSSSSSGSNTQKCYRCKWPLCDYTGEHSGNITRHIRTQHFNLPRTVREQRDKNIVDDRDPYAFVEVFHKPATTVSGQAIPFQRLGGSGSSVTDGSGSIDNESLTYGGTLTTDDGFGCSTARSATTVPSTQVSSSNATDLYVSGVFNQMKEEDSSCIKAVQSSTGKSETKAMEMMTTLAATAVAAAAAAAATSTSSTSMDTDDSENCNYHF